MRISDWSSDVCSSDLVSCQCGCGIITPARATATSCRLDCLLRGEAPGHARKACECFGIGRCEEERGGAIDVIAVADRKAHRMDAEVAELGVEERHDDRAHRRGIDRKSVVEGKGV